MTVAPGPTPGELLLPVASEFEEVPLDAPTTGREHFIPIRRADLTALLAAQSDLLPAEREKFQQLARLMEATLHYEYHLRLEELKNAYAPFDPDADTRPVAVLDPVDRDARASELFARFIDLLACCNFQRLSRDDIEEAAALVSDWGVNMDIDFGVFDRLEVFARGDTVGRRSRRRWRNWLRVEEVDVPIYQRLVVIFRLAEGQVVEHAERPDAIYVKIFKNVHKQDLEMLLPGAQVKMTLVDRTKIAFPTISGLGVSAYKATQLGILGKLLKGGVVAALAGGFWGVFGVVTVLGAMIGYAVKSFFTYLTTKDKYHLNLTRSLYFQNLDNNAGVLFRLTDEAEEQECREALLAWFLLWRRAGEKGWTERDLVEAPERFLSEQACVTVNFEYRDAIDNLRRWGLVETTSQGKFAALPIECCLHRLDHAWDHYFHHASPATCDAPQG